MMKYAQKSHFEKLYLIQPELYDKILPHLNPAEKNDVQDLNKEYNDETEGNDFTQNNVEDNPDPQVSDDIATQPPDINLENPNTSVDSEALTSKPSIVTPTSLPKMRPKKFLCDRCKDKGFTTRYSLRRHYHRFHEGNNRPVEIEPPAETPIKTNLKRPRPETGISTDFKKPNRQGIKRPPNVSYQEDDDEIPLKLPRNTLGIKRKNPFKENPTYKRAHWVQF